MQKKKGEEKAQGCRGTFSPALEKERTHGHMGYLKTVKVEKRRELNAQSAQQDDLVHRPVSETIREKKKRKNVSIDRRGTGLIKAKKKTPNSSLGKGSVPPKSYVQRGVVRVTK